MSDEHKIKDFIYCSFRLLRINSLKLFCKAFCLRRHKRNSVLQYTGISIGVNWVIALGVCRVYIDHEYSLNDLLTPWCRVLLESLTGLQLVKKFSSFHGTRRFITALTSVRHLSLFWASPIQSIYIHPTSWRSILILSTHLCLGLPSGVIPSGFPIKTLYNPSPLSYAPHAQPI